MGPTSLLMPVGYRPAFTWEILLFLEVGPLPSQSSSLLCARSQTYSLNRN